MMARTCVCALVLGTALNLMPAAPANADVTVLVNGSFNENPPWMDDWSPEFSAIADTYGYPPIQFRWLDNDAIYFFQGYSGIFNGGWELANFIHGLGLSGGEALNIVAHSHGGNVTLVASYYLNRSITHLINLGTPVNYDLPGLGGYGAYSHCQVSSFTDYVQFGGGSPFQIFMFEENQRYAVIYSIEAAQAAFDGDWEAFAYYSGLVAFYEAEAALWWLSTKIEGGANNLMFGNESHSDLHEPPVWHSIKYECALN